MSGEPSRLAPPEPRARGASSPALARPGRRPRRPSRAGPAPARPRTWRPRSWAGSTTPARTGHPAAQGRRQALATSRATAPSTMAQDRRHGAPGLPGLPAQNRDIPFDACGEVIAYTTWPWGHEAARSIFKGWRGSTDHWDLLMSPTTSGSGSASPTGRRTIRTWAAGILARAEAPRSRPYPEPVARHPFAAVNLISDPIHGYLELTKRLSRDESAAAGLPDEDAAEDDLLDTAWLQRLRRISQLQSARWVFPTAEHSRFTHGLGVMHEAGLWARTLLPSLRGALPSLAPGRAAARPRASSSRRCGSPGLLHDVGHGPFAHFFDDRVLAAFPAPEDARRGRRQAAVPRGPQPADHRARARRPDPGAPAGAGRDPGARRVRRRRGDRPALGLVPRLEAGAHRRVDAGLGAAAPAAPVGRVHGRQPRLRPPRRVLHRRAGRDRRRAAAALRVRLGARADAVRAGRRGARGLPRRADAAPPVGLLPPDRARDRPRPRARSSSRRSRRSSATTRRPTAWPTTSTSTSTRCSTRPRAGRAARTSRRRRRAASPAAGASRAPSPTAGAGILLRRPGWRAEAEMRASYEAGAEPAAEIAQPRRRPSRAGWPSTSRSSTRGRRVDHRLAIEGRDGAEIPLAQALARVPAYALIGRRYRRL